jgi:hypothetical protein
MECKSSSSTINSKSVTILRCAGSLALLGKEIASTISHGEREYYYLAGSLRIKSRKQAQKYLKNRKKTNGFDENLHNALEDSKNRFFAKILMKQHLPSPAVYLCGRG